MFQKQYISLSIAVAQLGLIALLVFGVMALPANATPQSEHVNATARQALANRGLLAGNSIEINADDSVITLSGSVATLAEKNLAERTVRDAVRNYRMVDSLSVEPAMTSDADIASQIAAKVRTYVMYGPFDWVTASVSHGVVTLRGYLQGPYQLRDYDQLAAAVPGVTAVDNKLQVLPASLYDDELRYAAARAIYAPDRLGSFINDPDPPVHIIVDAGRVMLFGQVPSPVDRTVAENDVLMSTLARSVDNELIVMP